MDLDDGIRRYSKARAEALDNSDPISYFYACVNLGIEPDDPILFERGSDLLGIFELNNNFNGNLHERRYPHTSSVALAHRGIFD